MRRIAVCTVLLLVAAGPGGKWTNRKCCDKGVPRPWAPYNKVGVIWQQPMEKAVEIARRERKLIMAFQLVGDMDKEGC